jgi:hypothetical protein
MARPPTLAGPSPRPPPAVEAERAVASRRPPPVAVAAGLAVALAAAGFLAQRANGLDLGDEGFIWYAALAVARGEVPLRDFRSYDPGWSYWIAGWFALLGRDGFVAVRLAASAAQAVALFAILWPLMRTGLGALWALAFGALWLLWAFDVPATLNAAVALGVTVAGAVVLERPSARRHLLAGAAAGAAAFIGRNHGLYAAIALAALVALTPPSPSRPSLLRRASSAALGLALGYAPMLVMCAAVPGFGRAFAESVFMWLRLGQTNLARDVPWPWRAARAQEIERAFGLGLLFLLVPLAVIALLALARARPRFRSPLLVSGAVTAAVYLHYTFSRPDEFHLARGAVPPLLAAVAALVACAGARTRRVAAVALAAFAALSGWVLAPRHGAWARARAPERFPPVMVGGDRLATARIDASLIRSARRAAAEGPGGLYAGPTVPGLYAVLGQRAPVWDIYPLLPATDAEQDDAIAELARRQVDRALLCPWEDRPAPSGLGFTHTHRRLWEHFRSGWTAADEAHAYDCRLLRRTALRDQRAGSASPPRARDASSPQAASMSGPPE